MATGQKPGAAQPGADGPSFPLPPRGAPRGTSSDEDHEMRAREASGGRGLGQGVGVCVCKRGMSLAAQEAEQTCPSPAATRGRKASPGQARYSSARPCSATLAPRQEEARPQVREGRAQPDWLVLESEGRGYGRGTGRAWAEGGGACAREHS